MAVNEFLIVYLDSIDERLLDYLDQDEELRRDTRRAHSLLHHCPARRFRHNHVLAFEVDDLR